MAPPVPEQRLKEIADQACDAALSSATAYDHTSCAKWNEGIIHKILESVVSDTSVKDGPSPYKFAVNSTIIQHTAPLVSETTQEPDQEAAHSKAGRRGMHSAAAAFWNSEKDGMWSTKYEGGEAKGMDVVLTVMWIAV
ncbi:putative dynein light chain protein [Eremomyces bilateralis CBS 781.70]|uniref:Dynein light chain protein n=1 Tax=Eremomyces bilateralis CBS 781.70 TaxID=1392243 RepID=A0A6G1G8J7_9PEZI|nr:putative dynein light chain protein [Eremomyces bilateralis CBS 781.70]KAF1814425.1 putative dynein light chain protein [Eremomyces bilateralis CBS 781.70]